MFAGATEFIVGDETGWIVGKNYTKWAENKTFKVGDKLVFQYRAVQHDVFWVGEPEFNSCKTSPYIEHQTSGNDEFLLTTPGRSWYICGKSNHCTAGMKLAINAIEENEAPAPSPDAPAPYPARGEGNAANMITYTHLVSVFVSILAMVVMH
ncbi:hypothetical protein KSP39_PZI012520 [Platanthera zijinensis]|uniref:Phytocyanin domain-containing protein n=1 Tax=Platanthera zijinensis TaxID=2320716 RepID=A0AAP0BFJ5_9ASPA